MKKFSAKQILEINALSNNPIEPEEVIEVFEIMFLISKIILEFDYEQFLIPPVNGNGEEMEIDFSKNPFAEKNMSVFSFPTRDECNHTLDQYLRSHKLEIFAKRFVQKDEGKFEALLWDLFCHYYEEEIQDIYDKCKFSLKMKKTKIELENNLRVHITKYEELADCGRAQSDEAKMNFSGVQKCLRHLLLDYNTKNLAKYGSKRAKKYIEKWPELGV